MEEKTNTNKRMIQCVDCPNKFPFSDRDEEFYRSKGWVNKDGSITLPKRCRACRERKKQQQY